METIRRIELERLREHPRNRDFLAAGPEWEVWLKDLKKNGVQAHATVRPMGPDPEAPEYYQLVKGHRRFRGSRDLLGQGLAEFGTLPVIVKAMSDAEALKELFRDNLLHETLDPVQEGEAVLALMQDLKASAVEVAAMVNRSVTWVTTRQLMLSLGDEVRSCVCLPKGDERHLDMGTVEVILAVPAEWREEAVQLVLHCDIFNGIPRRKEAETLIRQGLLEPKQAEAAWEKGLGKVVTGWKKRLREFLGKKLSQGMNVQGVSWGKSGDAMRGGIPAEVLVEVAELAEGAPERCSWGALAVKHLLPVLVVPDPRNEGLSLALVNEPVIRQMEEAAREAGQVSWLKGKRQITNHQGRVPSDPSSVISEQPEGTRPVGSVEGALAALDGEADPAWVAEDLSRAEAVVVEQVMERNTVIRMDEVVRLRAEAQAWLERPLPLEELTSKEATEERDRKHAEMFSRWPAWARQDHVFVEDVVAVCDWVLSLKYVPDPKANH